MWAMRPVAAVLVILTLAFVAIAGAASGSSPPPGKIVYSVATPDEGQLESHPLLTALSDGTGVTQITNRGPGWDVEARWSPDGARVAFTRVEPNGLGSTVWVVNADGAEPHPVSDGPSSAEHPRWSPDGGWIAFQDQSAFGTGGARDNTTYDLWIVRPDGSGLRGLDAAAAFGGSELFIGYGNAWSWSPDGKLIAYVDNDASGGGDEDEERATVVVLNVKTGRKHVLGSGSYPVWSPDGREVAFVDRCRLWLVPARGGKRMPLTPRTKGSCHSDLAWSPDGRWIASTVTKAAGGETVSLFVVTPDGKRPSRVRSIRAAAVRWPRDCEQLFFYEGHDVGWVGWIVHGAGGAPRFARLDRRYADWRC
jgi:Tol biopolymer transport system component